MGKPGLTSSLEDYLEAILAIGSAARVSDVAEKMSVAKASVNAAARRLEALGLVDFPRYGAITLTRRGKASARRVRRRHDTLVGFLTATLGVPRAVAERDACVLEHGLSPPTARRLLAFVSTHPPRPPEADRD